MLARPEWNDGDPPRERRYPPYRHDYLPIVCLICGFIITMFLWVLIGMVFENAVSTILALRQ